jgi:hypothetical protein
LTTVRAIWSRTSIVTVWYQGERDFTPVDRREQRPSASVDWPDL